MAVVGVDRFDAAKARQAETPVGELCHAWFDVVWEIFDTGSALEAADDLTRAQAVVLLYEQAPSYTVLNQGLRIHQRYEDLNRDARLHLWERLRPHLTGADDRSAEPSVQVPNVRAADVWRSTAAMG